VALHGSSTIPVNCLGLQSNNITWGHRFLSTGSITIDHADNYASLLEVQGKVLASFEARLEKIKSDLMAAANGLEVLMPQSLLEEVCSLVEWPVVYPCQFEKEFLDVPQECLILTMQTNQKYFALTDQSGKLSNKFLIVSNLATKTPEAIISGNERVVRPRLSDAKFFFEQDRKKPLAQRTPLLSKVVYHNKLGTQLERTERIQHIAQHIAQLLGQPAELAQKAALLAKADLLTDMVGEFPELQGIMGRYYATHDGEHADVAAACMEHYLPRFAGDSLPQTAIGMILALADKLETLVGIWGIGLAPTGEKDPFALRRHALGICRILIEKHLNLDIVALIEFVKSQFPQAEVQTQAVVADIHQFILDRLRAYLKDQQLDGEPYSTNEVESVASQQPRVIADVLQRLQAVRKFSNLPEAQSLAAANKRIGNILKKVDFEIPTKVDDALLSDGAEKQLADSVKKVTPLVKASFSQGDYTQGLISFASLKDPVDQFFNDVMVMDPNTQLRDNRLALLREMHTMMNQVADIGKLAG
jgi:glycyl-tRNA synthetase beta chain